MRTETIEYQEGATTCEGYAAYDDKAGKRPAILVVPEWNGVSDYTKKRAEMLAGLGYTAFVADIYGKGVRPTTMDACAAEAGKYQKDRPLLRQRAQAALDRMLQLPTADGRAAAIGYCFGGTAVLELARSGADLVGVVSFHGALNTPNPADAKNIKASVLVLHGADDPVVPDAEVLAFEKEMRDAKVDWEMVAYGSTVHSFTNWNLPENNPGPASYNKKSDQRSWIAMQNFFKEIFA
jgi:dienelactone hydrolase